LRAPIACCSGRPHPHRRAQHLSSLLRGRRYAQDLKYGGEPTATELGDDNTIRENVTISRGTAGGGGITRVGSGCLLMASAHIGHDSLVGSHCILANAATLAGHVVIEDYATVGAFSPVHQHCTVGRYAFIGGGRL